MSVEVPLAPAGPAAGPQLMAGMGMHQDPVSRLQHRVRRQNFFDLANLLDSDGNLQNEMMVFAFAATMLSTIPVLLGNEFDVNVGLRRRRRSSRQEVEEPIYATPFEDDVGAPFFSASTYKKLMTAPPGAKNIQQVIDGSYVPELPQYKESLQKDKDLLSLLKEVLAWSEEKTKQRKLLPLFVDLALDRWAGIPNPADKLVWTAYKKWKNLW